MKHSFAHYATLFFFLNLGCERPADLGELGSLEATDLPASTTNAYSDDEGAALFGQALFFDERMSAQKNLACVSCHDPEYAFSDPRPFSEGTFQTRGTRHAPSLINVAFNQFQLWDGGADSLWAQPIKAIESPLEGDFSRTELAHFIAAEYKEEYSEIFGAIPRLEHLPMRAKPGDPFWDSMSTLDKDTVNRIAANVGKAIEAYERKLLCVDTEFDQHLRGEVELSPLAQEGAQIFLENRAANCVSCHNGPNLSDGLFHNLGLDHAGTPDKGRIAAIESLLQDPLNGAGLYSDDPQSGQEKLAAIEENENDNLGAFKTPGLRGVAQRARFGHLGHEGDLEEWIEDVYDRNGGQGRNNRQMTRNFVGQLSPLFPRGLQGNDEQALAAFLRTFDCPPLPEYLTKPPENTDSR